MPRRREPKSAREKVAAVLRWAERQGFDNVAADLHDALAILPADEIETQRRRRRP
jgi:hypothetical protein